jgi:hypothetical protein
MHRASAANTVSGDLAGTKLTSNCQPYPGERSEAGCLFRHSRGVTNEILLHGAEGRGCMGTNHIDNAARLCHSPSGAAMKATLGVGASYVQLQGLVLRRRRRLLRLEPGQRSAGLHEVSARGEEARMKVCW